MSPKNGDKLTHYYRIGAGIVLLLLACYVVLNPLNVYAQTPRVVLYFLVALLGGILLTSEATARLELKLPGFLLTASGSAAIVFGALWLLTKLNRPGNRGGCLV